MIADLDVVTDNPKMKGFLNELAPAEERGAILDACGTLEQQVRSLPPILTEQAVKDELLKIAESITSWSERDDV